MWDSFVARLSRRKALKLGAGIVALTATLGPIEAVRALAAAPDGSTSDLMNGVGMVEAVDEDIVHTDCDGSPSRNVLARMVDGQTVTAKLRGFPAGFSPRVGDLVAVDTRTLKPLCLPTGVQTVAVEPTAHPLSSWSLGIPATLAGVLRIGHVHLVPNADLLQAAERRATIQVLTLDSTLPDRQVLAIRTP